MIRHGYHKDILTQEFVLCIKDSEIIFPINLVYFLENKPSVVF